MAVGEREGSSGGRYALGLAALGLLSLALFWWLFPGPEPLEVAPEIADGGAETRPPADAPARRPGGDEGGPAVTEVEDRAPRGAISRAAAARSPDPLAGELTVLPNGLTVYIVESHEAPVIAAWVVVRAGAARDPEGMEGAAHLLEHLTFRGTDELGALEWGAVAAGLAPALLGLEAMGQLPDPVAREQRRLAARQVLAAADALGNHNEVMQAFEWFGFSEHNAFTSLDATTYQALLPANALEPWAMLEAERFTEPALRGLERERMVAIQELLDRSHSPETEAQEALRAALFPGHPYGRSLGGDPSSLEQIPPSALLALHRGGYSPANAAVILVGDLDPDEALKTIEWYFGELPEADAPAALAPPEEGPAGAVLPGGRLRLAWRLPPAGHEDYPALELLAQRINNAGGRPRMTAAVQRFADAGLLSLTASCGLEPAGGCQGEVTDRLQELSYVSTDELNAALSSLLMRRLEDLESPMSRAQALADDFAMGLEPGGLEASITRLERVSRGDLRRVAQRYLGDRLAGATPLAPVELSPYQERRFPEAVPETDERSAFFDDLTDLELPELAPVWLAPGADYAVGAAPHALVFAAENPINALYELRLRYPIGWLDQPLLCAAMEHWIHQLERTPAPEPVRLQSRCAADSVELRLKGFAEGAGASLEALADSLVEGALPEPSDELVEVARARMSAEALDAWLRGGEGGTLPSLEAMLAADRAALQAALRGLLSARPTASYTGPHSPEAVAAALTRLGAPRLPPDRPPPQLRALSEPLLLRYRSNSYRSGYLTLVRPGEPYDPEHGALYALFDAWLSGPAGAVFEELRAERGAAYSPQAVYQRGARPGAPNMVEIRVQSRVDRATEVVEVLLELLRTAELSDTQWAQLRAAAGARLRDEALPFREVSQRLSLWAAQGHEGDPRPAAWERLQELDRRDFEAFLEREAAAPPTLLLYESPQHPLDTYALRRLGTVRDLDPPL